MGYALASRRGTAMRTDDWQTSENIEDRRDDSGGGGGGFGMPVGAGGLGIGGLVVLGLLGWALGIDPRLLIGGGEVLTRHEQPYRPPIQNRPSSKTSQPADSAGNFVSKVLRQNEDRWREIFEKSGGRYQAPNLVLFRARGTVIPDSFTHGSSDQRMRWFNTGFKQGTVDSCNTFAAAQL